MAIDRAALALANQAKNRLDNAGGVNVKDFGAKGDGISDDTAAFRAAMAVCNMSRTLIVPAGTYRITDTIVNNAGRIVGEGRHIDSGKGGTLILFDMPRTAVNDMKPCFHFTKGSNLWVEYLSVKGTFSYNVRELASYINKDLFDQRKIEMFVPGLCSFLIDSEAQVSFNNVGTSSIKCGVYMNNRTGHITYLECSLSGLFGIYVRRNTGDFFMMGGTLGGAFCGCLLGDVGANWEMIRVHMGFSPYGFYQVDDGQIASGAELNRKGMVAWQFKAVKFEVIGECAIDLLPDSLSWATSIEAYGFSWSTLDTTAGWYFGMPDSLVPQANKQKYALRLGIVEKVRFSSDYTTGHPFNLPRHRSIDSGDKVVYISNLRDDFIMDEAIEGTVEIAAKNSFSRTAAGYKSLYADAVDYQRSPVTSGQLINTNPMSWDIRYCSIEAVSAADLPAGLTLSREILEIYGNSPPIYKLTPTPGTTNNPEVGFPMVEFPNSVYSGWLYYRGFAGVPTVDAKSEVISMLEGRDVNTGQFLEVSPSIVRKFSSPKWLLLHANQVRRSNTRMTKAKYSYADRVNPFYFLPPIVSQHVPLPYSPTMHGWSRSDMELAPGKSIIMRSPNGVRYRIGVSDAGVLMATPI